MAITKLVLVELRPPLGVLALVYGKKSKEKSFISYYTKSEHGKTAQ
jgi:hypothetical protein